MTKKVTVAIPTTDYVHVNFAVSLAQMVKQSNLDLKIAIARGANICVNRNRLVHEAQKCGDDFILFLDNDLSFPPVTVDRLVKIADGEQIDVVGCNYLFKAPPHYSMVTPKNRQDQTLRGVDEVDRLPTGLMLIRMNVFDKLKEPYFIYESADYEEGYTSVTTEDYPFCDRVRAAGVSIWMDSQLSFSIVHWGGTMGFRWIPEAPNVQYLFEPLKYENRSAA